MVDPARLLFRSALALTNPAGQQRLSILIYHRVMAERDPMRPGEPTVAEFDWQMQLLKRHFNMLPLVTATRLLREGRLPPRSACITFDDGYADNATLALPVLQRHAIPATVFVASGYLNGGQMWNDTVIESLRRCPAGELDLSAQGLPVYMIGDSLSRRRAAYDVIRRGKYREMAQREDIAACLAALIGSLGDDLMLTTAQVQMLHNSGVEIGGHTVFHPILSRLPLTSAKAEIEQGKEELETLIAAPLRVFAYPNGQPETDFSPDHAALVKAAGFEAAVTTCWGVSARQTDPFQMARFTPWDKSPIKFLLRMALNDRHVAHAAEL